MPEDRMRSADEQQAERLHLFAHDIKNKLGGLWECLRLLNDGPIEGMDRKELMAFAERSFFGAQRQVEELLNDLGVDRGVKVERVTFDLATALQDALKVEGSRLRKKEQRVEITGPDSLPAQGDPHWSTQLLQALVSNASKFSARGSVISIVLERIGETCVVRVTDQGCGLSQIDRALLFTRYVVLSSRSTEGEPQSRGTLARARQWALAQGGELGVSNASSEGGCTFQYVLPAAT